MNSEDGQTADARAKNFRMSEYEENMWEWTYMAFYKSDKKTVYACFLFCVYTDFYT